MNTMDIVKIREAAKELGWEEKNSIHRKTSKSSHDKNKDHLKPINSIREKKALIFKKGDMKALVYPNSNMMTIVCIDKLTNHKFRTCHANINYEDLYILLQEDYMVRNTYGTDNINFWEKKVSNSLKKTLSNGLTCHTFNEQFQKSENKYENCNSIDNKRLINDYIDTFNHNNVLNKINYYNNIGRFQPEFDSNCNYIVNDSKSLNNLNENRCIPLSEKISFEDVNILSTEPKHEQLSCESNGGQIFETGTVYEDKTNQVLDNNEEKIICRNNITNYHDAIAKVDCDTKISNEANDVPDDNQVLKNSIREKTIFKDNHYEGRRNFSFNRLNYRNVNYVYQKKMKKRCRYIKKDSINTDENANDIFQKNISQNISQTNANCLLINSYQGKKHEEKKKKGEISGKKKNYRDCKPEITDRDEKVVKQNNVWIRRRTFGLKNMQPLSPLTYPRRYIDINHILETCKKQNNDYIYKTLLNNECIYCGLIFDSLFKLQVHLQYYTKHKVYYCCGKLMINYKSLERHLAFPKHYGFCPYVTDVRKLQVTP